MDSKGHGHDEDAGQSTMTDLLRLIKQRQRVGVATGLDVAQLVRNSPRQQQALSRNMPSAPS
jgi:hypothetical protein